MLERLPDQAGGAKGSVIHWDGTSWTSTPIDTNNSLQAIYGTGPNDIWAVSTASLIYRSSGFSNGTATFVRETPIFENAQLPTTVAPLFAVWATGPGDVWISGKHRLLKAGQLETSWRTGPGDGGVGWTPLNGFGDNNVIYDIWGSGPNDVWMVGSKGTTTSFASHTTSSASRAISAAPVTSTPASATARVRRSRGLKRPRPDRALRTGSPRRGQPLRASSGSLDGSAASGAGTVGPGASPPSLSTAARSRRRSTPFGARVPTTSGL